MVRQIVCWEVHILVSGADTFNKHVKQYIMAVYFHIPMSSHAHMKITWVFFNYKDSLALSRENFMLVSVRNSTKYVLVQ